MSESMFHVSWTVISVLIGFVLGYRMARREEARRG